MEITVLWSKQAESGLLKTINYLKEYWTSKEIIRLEKNLSKFIEKIKLFPKSCPESSKYRNLFKGMVDENNYIVYKVYPKKKEILIVNFRNGKQKPMY